MSHTTIIALFLLAFGGMMIWQTKSRSSLVSGGVCLGWATMLLMEAHMGIFMQQMLNAFLWFNAVGLTGFMLVTGSIALGLIWVFQRL